MKQEIQVDQLQSPFKVYMIYDKIFLMVIEVKGLINHRKGMQNRKRKPPAACMYVNMRKCFIHKKVEARSRKQENTKY